MRGGGREEEEEFTGADLQCSRCSADKSCPIA